MCSCMLLYAPDFTSDRFIVGLYFIQILRFLIPFRFLVGYLYELLRYLQKFTLKYDYQIMAGEGVVCCFIVTG